MERITFERPKTRHRKVHGDYPILATLTGLSTGVYRTQDARACLRGINLRHAINS